MNRFDVLQLSKGSIVKIISLDNKEYVGIFECMRHSDINSDASFYALITYGRRSMWTPIDRISHQMTQEQFKAWVESKQQKS